MPDQTRTSTASSITAESVGHVRVMPVTGLVSASEMWFVPKKSWFAYVKFAGGTP